MSHRISNWYPLKEVLSVLLLAAIPVLSGCGGVGTTAGTWEPLFNGTDLTGWTVKCRPADRDNEFWKVDDGSLLADSMDHEGHDYVWLVTDREYADFALRLRFQAYRDSPGNSGIQIRSRYDDEAGWLDGPQIDIHPPGPWRTGMIWDETRGVGRWLYPDRPQGQWVNPTMANPDMVFYYADEGPGWNTLEIRAVGPRIIVLLNGVIVTDCDGSGILDDSVHQGHDVGLKGHIALQIHKADRLRIRFKDIVIRELAAP
ncbi:MAG: DUF1080 domain-containing protein [Sedimentisphaerales bacterium]|jgi:hypothetical protein|nr:DUF1080 domain-containing protein [Sedimentisphaerales bacterium]NLT75204.1 DUF1080 domain-containing protein [Planctomycetota bacterium]